MSSAIAVISARTNFVVSQRLFVVAEFVGHLQASVLFCSPCDVSVEVRPPELPQLLLFFRPGCMFGIGAHERQIVNKLWLCTDSRQAFTVNTKKCNRAFTEGLNDRTACLFILF